MRRSFSKSSATCSNHYTHHSYQQLHRSCLPTCACIQDVYIPESQVITADASLLWSFSFTNHQSLMTTGFPMNYRWRAYISPKFPKGWLKKSLFVYFFDKIQLQSNKVCYKVSKTFRGLSRTTFVFKDFQGL